MTKKIDYISLFARLALAIGFLSAVADRLGLWTPLLGSENVVWGNMESFTAYTGVLLPSRSIPRVPIYKAETTLHMPATPEFLYTIHYGDNES